MSALAGYLSLTLLFGAAHNDATPEQREQMRERVLPLTEELGDKSTSPARVEQLIRLILEEIVRIMGPHWQLSGPWAEQIDKLLKGKKDKGR